MKTKFRVKAHRILLADYCSFVISLLSFALFAMGMALSPLFVLPIPLFLAVIWWRVALIRRTISQGKIVTALVDKVCFINGEWLIDYTFNAEGKDYCKRTAVISLNSPLGIDVSSVVQASKSFARTLVSYDPKRPNQAFLPELYGAIEGDTP